MNNIYNERKGCAGWRILLLEYYGQIIIDNAAFNQILLFLFS